ncbi:MAG: putative glycosyltransferase/glycerophosphotransferase [Propionibacteriaceae bacterium]|jgi:CDP-glycerol glycerophosphotransferase|nr:putative glycosyltransferase/glycerophosphotransferase [Propionibacteriaceae bacterium]
MTRPHIARLDKVARWVARPAIRAVRRKVRKLTGAVRPVSQKPAKTPLLSVVVAVSPSDRYLQECLGSLLTQSLNRIEVILVGTPDFVLPTSVNDRRVRVLRRAAGGPAAARNFGAAAAAGTYLTFVEASDTVPPDAFAQMTRALQRSGSDFVVGALHRVRNGRGTKPAWVNSVHALDRIGVNVDEFPVAMQDVVLFNRVFRRTFWRESIGQLAEGSASGDLVATVTGYIRAKSFDVLRAITYQSQLRADNASIPQERYNRALLDDRIAALEGAWQVVSAEASAAVAGAWLGGVIDTDLGAFLEQAAAADDAYRERLQRACRSFIAEAGPLVWPHVRIDRRLRVWLGAEGRWTPLEHLVEFFRLNGSIPPTRVVDGSVIADLPIVDELVPDVPAFCLELAESQTALSACVQRAYFASDGRLVVDGWAFIRGVDLATSVPTQHAALVDSQTGEEVPVSVQQRVDPAATYWANHLNQSVDTSAFQLRIDVDALPPPDPTRGPRRWSLQMTVVARGIERSGVVRSVVRSGSALRMRARPLAGPLDPVRIVPVIDPGLGFTVQARPDRLRAADLACADGRRLSGRIRVINPIAAPLVHVLATSSSVGTSSGGTVTAELREGDDGWFRFDLDLPAGEPNLVWTFRALDENGTKHRVSWPDEASAGVSAQARDASVAWLRSARGFCDIRTDLCSFEAESVAVGSDAVTIDVWASGLTEEQLGTAVLRSHRTSVVAMNVRQLGPDRYRLTFPTRTSVWGGPSLPLASGAYSVGLEDTPRASSGAPTPLGVVCGVTDAFLECCPIEGRTELHGFSVGRASGADRLVVTLRPPLADDEIGRRAQRRLADWYQETEFEPSDAVLFQCYRGEFATDSQLAIHQELYRRGSHLELRWGVSDLSVSLPEGTVPLLIGSRAWYEAVASSRYLCQNIDFDRFFRKRPYQRYLQTFHGYPFKSMGISLWRAQGRTAEVIDGECERRNADWDSILVPAQFCEPMYRQEYRYQHEVLVTGYPRDDLLVTAEPETARNEVLKRIGVNTDKTVVLYAPTWRDTVATGAFRAKLFAELDLDRLTSELGTDYVILVRGHNYNLREGEQVRSAAVVDVTSYPEINDLILAADVALLDYSSLRFDWLLTGKPALFFVPDLADYLSARTALFEYGPTAPGPLLRTTEEVVDALQRVDQVGAEYAADRAAFNARFHGLHDGHATSRVVDQFFGTDAGPGPQVPDPTSDKP